MLQLLVSQAVFRHTPRHGCRHQVVCRYSEVQWGCGHLNGRRLGVKGPVSDDWYSIYVGAVRACCTVHWTVCCTVCCPYDVWHAARYAVQHAIPYAVPCAVLYAAHNAVPHDGTVDMRGRHVWRGLASTIILEAMCLDMCLDLCLRTKTWSTIAMQ